MDDMINRHDSIAEENIEPNGRPAKNQFEEWSSEVTDRADNVFKDDTKDGPIKNRKKRIKDMDDMINRHDSIAEENIEPNGRPAKNQFEEWSSEVTDRADNVFKDDTKDGPIKNRKKRIKEMDEVIKKDLE